MDYQVLFNLAMGAIGGLLLLMINALRQSLKQLTADDRELEIKVNAIEVLVVGSFVRRVEFDAKIDAVFVKLDSIEEKLDRRLSTRLGDRT